MRPVNRFLSKSLRQRSSKDWWSLKALRELFSAQSATAEVSLSGVGRTVYSGAVVTIRFAPERQRPVQNVATVLLSGREPFSNVRTRSVTSRRRRVLNVTREHSN